MTTRGIHFRKNSWTLNKVNKNQILLIIMVVSIIGILVDLSFLRLYDLTPKNPLSFGMMSLICCLAVIFTSTHLFVSRYITKQNIPFLRTGQFRIIHIVVFVINLILTFLMLRVIHEMWTNTYFEISYVTIALVLSYGLGISMTGYLSYKFLLWFKSNHGKTIVLYFISSALITSTAIFTLVFLYSILSTYTVVIPTYTGTAMYLSAFQEIILSITNLLATLAFISTWLATTILLRYRSRIIGSIRYWVITALPLVYFLSQFLSFITNGFSFLLENDPIFVGMVLTLLFTFSKLVGGILFGLAFWIMAKSIAAELEVPRNLIRMAGYGYVILFMSTQTVAFSTVPYPPFGLFTILFYGIGSYMILVGVYFSVIVVSEDSRMRKLIRKATESEPSLISDISYAQLENVIEKRTTRLVNNLIVEPVSSLSTQESNYDELKSYALSVLSEIESQNPRYSVLIEKQREMQLHSNVFFGYMDAKLLRIFRDHHTSNLGRVGEDHINGFQNIRIITSINVTSIEVVKDLLSFNVKVKHLAITDMNNFIVTNKELLEIPPNWEYAVNDIQIDTNISQVRRFQGVFEDLWEKSIEPTEQIKILQDSLN